MMMKTPSMDDTMDWKGEKFITAPSREPAPDQRNVDFRQVPHKPLLVDGSFNHRVLLFMQADGIGELKTSEVSKALGCTSGQSGHSLRYLYLSGFIAMVCYGPNKPHGWIDIQKINP